MEFDAVPFLPCGSIAELLSLLRMLFWLLFWFGILERQRVRGKVKDAMGMLVEKNY